MRGRLVRRLGATVAATTLASAGVLVATAQPAAAAPTDCVSYVNLPRITAISYCSGGAGTHQAVAVCADGHMVFGARRPPGVESFASCERWTAPSTWVVTGHAYWLYDH